MTPVIRDENKEFDVGIGSVNEAVIGDSVSRGQIVERSSSEKVKFGGYGPIQKKGVDPVLSAITSPATNTGENAKLQFNPLTGEGPLKPSTDPRLARTWMDSLNFATSGLIQ